MAPGHVARVAEIEGLSSPQPWSARQVEEEIAKPHARAWVWLAGDGRPGAFGVYWAVAGEAQLANLAVAPGFRRRGWGRRLLRHLMARARAEGCGKMTLEVRESNGAARRLYGGAGFVETGRRPGVYGGREAAVLMETLL